MIDALVEPRPRELELRLVDAHLRERLVARLGGAGLALQQIDRALVVGLAELERGLRLLDGGAPDRVVEQHQRLALLDRLAFLEAELDDPAGDLRPDDHQFVRAQRADRGQAALDRADLDRRGLDRHRHGGSAGRPGGALRLRLLEVEEPPGAARNDQHGSCDHRLHQELLDGGPPARSIPAELSARRPDHNGPHLLHQVEAHTPVCGRRAKDAKSRRRGVLSLFAAGLLCGLADQSVTERPPSTASTWPLTYAPALDARNTTAPPSSSGLAQRPSGVRCSTQAVKL